MFEPEIRDRRRAIGRAKNNIKGGVAAGYLAQPTLILDPDFVAELLEQRQDARPVASLAENIKILGFARNTGICTHGERAGDKKGYLCFRDALDCFSVKGFLLGSVQHRLGARVDRCWLQ